MKIGFLISFVISSFFIAIDAEAKISLNRSPQDSDITYDAGSKAASQIIDLSLRMTPIRSKIPGGWGFFSEAGYRIAQANERDLSPYTSTGSSGSEFQSLFARLGMGMPLGFNFSAGISQIASQHPLTGLFAHISYQLLDFSSLAETDLIPSLAIHTGGTRSLLGPGQYSFDFTPVFGVYNRQWPFQAAYGLSFIYCDLVAVRPSVDRTLFNHSFSMQIPLIFRTYLRSEFSFPDLSATALVGWDL